jgi:hypothetical protein
MNKEWDVEEHVLFLTTNELILYYEVILSNMAKWLELKSLLGSEVSILNIYTLNE